MTKQLVSFGNFLLKKYGVKVYSTDGTNIPLYDRLVDDVDISNWEYENPDLCRALLTDHQIGDRVVFSIGPAVILNCSVIKIHFTRSTVSYDLEVRVGWVDESLQNHFVSNRLYNVDSAFVTKPVSL